MNKAAFFDRDGTINVDKGYSYKPEEMQLIEGMPEFIRRFNRCGYKVIVISNQAGVARGYYTEDDVDRFNVAINDAMKAVGAHIDAFYYCPHHPDITGPCACRKPGSALFERAIAEHDIDANTSVMFGDKPWDIEAAERCGIKGYLLNETNEDNGA